MPLLYPASCAADLSAVVLLHSPQSTTSKILRILRSRAVLVLGQILLGPAVFIALHLIC
jgi:hypothetical protein